MPKFKDGYQTSLGSRLNVTRVYEALTESLIRDNLLASSLDVKTLGNVHPLFVTGLYDSEDQIPLFPHPFYLKTRNGKEILATDLRLYLKKNGFDGTVTSIDKAVVSKVEYNFTRSRSILNLYWIEGDVDSLKTSLSFSTAMFGKWIADVLSKAYALDPRDQLMVAIASSYYYQALFTDSTEYDEDTLHKWRIHTEKVTNADQKTVKEVFNKMPKIQNIESLVMAIRASTDNIRLDNLNVISLLTLLKNSWYGVNSKEIITVATEHPPTWMAIVYASLMERTWRSSLIFKIAERVGKRGLSDEYVNNVTKILSEYKVSNAHTSLILAGLA